MPYPHEKNLSENARFWDAVRDAGLSDSEARRFSDEYHGYDDTERMSYREIYNLAKEWKDQNGGGYRRSDY